MNQIRIVFVILVSLLAESALAQTPDFQIDTQASGPVNVCGDAITFTLTIKKLTGSSAQNIRLFPQMPAGMTYVAGTAIGMSEVAPVDPVNASFTLSDFTGQQTVSFQGKADCSLIATLKATGSTSNLIKNNTKLTYTVGGTDKEVLETNGSDSYSVLYPELELFVPESEKNMGAPFINKVMNRHITIKNSGLGSITSFDFYLKTDAELSLDKLELQTSSGAQVINYSGITPLGKKHTISDFTIVGDGDNYFEEGEEIHLTDYVKATTSKGSIETIYTAQWGCAGMVCNADENLSKFAAYVEAVGGKPSIPLNFHTVKWTDFCNDTPAIIQYDFKNNGSGNLPTSRDAAFNVSWTVPFAGYNTTNNFDFYILKSDNTPVKITTLVHYQEYNYTYNGFNYIQKYYKLDFSNVFTYDPDGVGGLDDVDGDGFYDDLPVDATLTTQAWLKFTFIGDLLSVRGQRILDTGNWFQYEMWSGKSDGLNYGYPFINLNVIDQNFQGPSDLVNGKTESFKAVINAGVNSLAHHFNNGSFEIDIQVPDGVALKSAKWGNKSLSFTQQGAQIKIFDPLGKSPANYTIDLDFELSCAPTTVSATSILFDMYCYSDYACPTTRFKVGELKKDVYLHCSSCASTETTLFTAERTTLGWVPLTPPKYYYTYNELYGPSPTVPKVTRTTPGIQLDGAYPKDEVETVIQGRVATATANLSAEIKYNTKLNLEAFQYKSASFIVNGVTYNFPSSYQPSKIISGGAYTYTYTIPLGTSGWPAQLNAGTVFELKIQHIVNEMIGVDRGEYPVNDLRGRFFSTVNGVPTSCVGFGRDFTLYKPEASNKSINFQYSFDAKNNVMVGQVYGNWTNRDNFFKRDFDNEFRPLNYVNTMTTTLPKGFIFDTSKPATFSPDYYSGLSYTLKDVTYSADKRTITIPLTGNMPIGERAMAFYAHALIDCTNPDNLFVPTTDDYERRLQPVTLIDNIYSYLPSVTNHLKEDAVISQLAMYNKRKPDLRLTANSIQEGYGDKVSWPVQLCNLFSSYLYSNPSLHTWVAFELKSDDYSTVLESAVDENNKPLPVSFYGPKDALHPKGRNILIKMDTIQLTSCVQIKIIASYKNCEPDKIQDVNVYSSWDYYSYPDVSNYTGSIVDHKASCEGNLLTETASIKYKTAALQWEITKATDSVDLCTPVPFDIDLTSTQYADMRDLKVWLDLPPYSSIDGSVPPKFSYPIGNTSADIPGQAYLSQNGKIGWDINKILGGNLPGIRLPANKIRLAFNLTTSCGFDPGLPIKYTVNGYTNCGDYVEYVDQRKIKLLGVPVDTVDLKLSAPPTFTCNSENEISVLMKNSTSKPSLPSQLEIVLPAGTQFREITQGDLPSPTISEVNGIVKLQWSLSAGYLNSGEEKLVGIKTFLSRTPAGTTAVSISARTFKMANANCSSDSTSTACALQVTSGLSELTVPVTGLASLNIHHRRYLCAYKFTPLISDRGCTLSNYKWDFGDGKTSADRAPFHAYSQAGTYNVSVSVDFSCGGCGGSQSKQIQLVVNPNDALYRDSVIQVLTEVKQQVLQVSASTFSDSWPSQQINSDLSKRNGYLNGTLGVWRNEGAFVYNVPRSASTSPNVAKDGTFSLDQFNWDYAELDAIPGWVRANTMTQYSPYSYELENRDVLGIYSGALYDYGGHLPSANGVNMRNSEMAFTGFEFFDGGASGNWIFGTRSLPGYFLYDLNSASGNAAVVKASMKDLDGVDRVDVVAKGRANYFISLFYPTFGIRYNSIKDDSIICKQPYPPHPEWTIIVLKQAPFNSLWNGRIKVNNEVIPTETANIDNTIAHSGKSSLKITSEKTFKQNLLQLDSGVSYMLSGWVSVNKTDVTTPKLADDLGIDISVRDKQGKIISTFPIKPNGPVIEGWQQVKGTFKFPGAKDATLELTFKPGSTGSAWYDDLRFHPEKGNMKSYVYDLKDYRLRAILDEENFASFYFYDEEGNLYLVKKETEAGVKTISENISSLKQK